MPEQFSRRQVELILRRTAELERRHDSDDINASDLERVAEELGMSQAALKQALAESRAGLLEPQADPGLLDKVFGPTMTEARRHVPGDLASVRAAVDQFLEVQGFQVKRRRGEVTVWESASGLMSWVRRTFKAGPYRLPRDVDIEVRIAEVPGGAHPVLVQLRVAARRLRSSRAGGAATALVLGTGAAVVGAVMLPIPTELVTWGAGAALAAGGTLVGRSSYRSARDQVHTALERFLDFLEVKAAPAPAGAAAADPVTRLVDFLAKRDWWR